MGGSINTQKHRKESTEHCTRSFISFLISGRKKIKRSLFLHPSMFSNNNICTFVCQKRKENKIDYIIKVFQNIEKFWNHNNIITTLEWSLQFLQARARIRPWTPDIKAPTSHLYIIIKICTQLITRTQFLWWFDVINTSWPSVAKDNITVLSPNIILRMSSFLQFRLQEIAIMSKTFSINVVVLWKNYLFNPTAHVTFTLIQLNFSSEPEILVNEPKSCLTLA